MACMTRVERDYEAYKWFCKRVGEEPLPIRDAFYHHEDEVMEKHGFYKFGRSYKKKEDAYGQGKGEEENQKTNQTP